MKSLARLAADLVPTTVSEGVTSTVNYFIDAWWARIDARNASYEPEIRLPRNIEQHAINSYLGCTGTEQFMLTRSFPQIFIARVAYAMECLVQEGTPFASVDFLPTYEFAAYVEDVPLFRCHNTTVEIAPKKELSLPNFKSYFLQCAGVPVIVRMDLCVNSVSCDFTAISAVEHKAVAEKFMAELSASMVSNDIYYRQCLSFESGSLSFHDITSTSFSQVVMKPNLKEKIIQNTIGVLESADQLLGLGICPSRNTLLVSPPGMAKSTVFRSLSTMLEGKATRIWCTGKSIRYPEHVTSLFAAARELGPCMVFIEDMDLFGGDRSSSHDSVVLNEFLSCLDGQVENSGVVILASTNDFLSMDEALTNRPGRFDMKVEIPMPDKEDRHALLQSFFARYHAQPDASVTAEIWDSVLEMSDGFTGAYMQELAKSCVLLSTRQNGVHEGVCTFTSSQLTASIESVLENWRMGQKAKKHHYYKDQEPGQNLALAKVLR